MMDPAAPFCSHIYILEHSFHGFHVSLNKQTYILNEGLPASPDNYNRKDLTL